MYLVFFGMKNLPFVRAVPASALYEPPEISEALARLEYVAEHQQFAAVTGDSGVGKSTSSSWNLDSTGEIPKGSSRKKLKCSAESSIKK